MNDDWKYFVFQLDKQQFEETIQTLNNLYAEAEKLGGKSYLEGCLACLTAYTVFLCMETHYEKVKYTLVSLVLVLVIKLLCFKIWKKEISICDCSGFKEDCKIHQGPE